MPTVQDFRAYIQYTKGKAADQGLRRLELSAEGIHQSIVGLENLTSYMATCREAMEAERGPLDTTLPPRDGKRGNLTILYSI